MTNLPTIYRRFSEIYRSATSRCPAVRPNRPAIVRHFTPNVRREPSRHSTDNRPISRPNLPTIYRRFGGIYRPGRNTLPPTHGGLPAAPTGTAANGLPPEVLAGVGRCLRDTRKGAKTPSSFVSFGVFRGQCSGDGPVLWDEPQGPLRSRFRQHARKPEADHQQPASHALPRRQAKKTIQRVLQPSTTARSGICPAWAFRC